LRGELEAQAAGLPVSFPGSLNGGPAVADYLRSLDLFVMPSRYEGLPNAALEALACGIGVVATDVAGMREATGTAARLVPAEDPDALATAILDALSTPSRGSAPSTRSFADVAADHMAVFERAVARRHQRGSAVEPHHTGAGG